MHKENGKHSDDCFTRLNQLPFPHIRTSCNVRIM